jgi:hypothetical protein
MFVSSIGSTTHEWPGMATLFHVGRGFEIGLWFANLGAELRAIVATVSF